MENDAFIPGSIGEPVSNKRFEKSLCFGEVNSSGLGDRLLYIYFISVLAYMVESNCRLIWFNPDDTSRSYDLDIVKRYISLPKWVEIQAREETSSNWEKMDGRIQKVVDSWRIKFHDVEYMIANSGQFRFHSKSDPLDLSRCTDLMLWMESVNSGICDSKHKLNDLCEKAREIGGLYNISFAPTPNLPLQYLCLHFRGGDKRQEGRAMFNCRYNTADIIKQIRNKCKLPILLVTDDDTEFIQTHNIDITQLTIPSFSITDYTSSCIRDLHILQSSTGIIQHSPHGWSSFSNHINIRANKPLISTCRNDYNIYYPDICAHLSGKKWENHFNFDEVDKFIVSTC